MNKEDWHYGVYQKDIGEKFIKEANLKDNQRTFVICLFIDIVISIIFFVGFHYGFWEQDITLETFIFCILFFPIIGSIVLYFVMKKYIEQSETGNLYAVTCVCEQISERVISGYGLNELNRSVYTLTVNIKGNRRIVKCWNKCIHREIVQGDEITLVMFNPDSKRQMALALEKVYEEYR